MDTLFDPTPYEEDPRVEAMGEQPPLTAQDWLQIADQMHDIGNHDAMEHALGKHERARRIEGTSEFVGGVSLFDSVDFKG